jgi:rhodanese-related sulfurtransferase
MYKALDPSSLKSMLDGPSRPRLIDVRTPAETARGVIEGAELVELSTLPGAIERLSPNEPLVIYCHSGGRSAQACDYLMQRGFKDVYNLEGGITGWAKAGMPVRQ